MELDEADAINAYKSYAENHLPEVDTLGGLWAPDFDPTAYPNLDMISALRSYLDALDPYCNSLNRAAELRQHHYELFIRGIQQEGDGHRFWREGMNRIAEDCREKSQYWSRIHNRLLEKVIVQYEIEERRKESQRAPIDITIRNPDMVVTKKSQKTQRFNPKSITVRPPISKTERERRKREYKLWTTERKARETQLIEEATDITKCELNHRRKLTREFELKMQPNQPESQRVTIQELTDICRTIGMNDPLNNPNIRNKGTIPMFISLYVSQSKPEEDHGELFDVLMAGLWKLKDIKNAVIKMDRNSEDPLTNYVSIWKQLGHFRELSLDVLSWLMSFLIECRGVEINVNFHSIPIYFKWAIICLSWSLTDLEILQEVVKIPDSSRKRAVIKAILNISAEGFYVIADKMYIQECEGFTTARLIDRKIRKIYGAGLPDLALIEAWRKQLLIFNRNIK
jgi:hypothetical protein